MPSSAVSCNHQLTFEVRGQRQGRAHLEKFAVCQLACLPQVSSSLSLLPSCPSSHLRLSASTLSKNRPAASVSRRRKSKRASPGGGSSIRRRRSSISTVEASGSNLSAAKLCTLEICITRGLAGHLRYFLTFSTIQKDFLHFLSS